MPDLIDVYNSYFSEEILKSESDSHTLQVIHNFSCMSCNLVTGFKITSPIW